MITNMTWTLRFYGGDGVEIGYIQKPDRGTYNWEVTHPDPGWGEFKQVLGSYWTLEQEDDYGMESPDWRADHGPMSIQMEPEPHLREVRERLDHPEVAEAVLRDE